MSENTTPAPAGTTQEERERLKVLLGALPRIPSLPWEHIACGQRQRAVIGHYYSNTRIADVGDNGMSTKERNTVAAYLAAAANALPALLTDAEARAQAEQERDEALARAEAAEARPAAAAQAGQAMRDAILAWQEFMTLVVAHGRSCDCAECRRAQAEAERLWPAALAAASAPQE